MRFLIVVLGFVFATQVASGKDFVSVWRITETKRKRDREVRLPLLKRFDYNFTVDWGDGSRGKVTSYDDPDAVHAYEQVGEYTVTISGLVEAWSFFRVSWSAQKLIAVTELGDVGWKSLYGAFYGCRSLEVVRGGNTSNVTEMSLMFYRAYSVRPEVSEWDTSNVKRMKEMFAYTRFARPEVSAWNTGKVNNMEGMFNSVKRTPDVLDWNTANVSYMNHMFSGAKSINPDMSGWNFSAVGSMYKMFDDVKLPTETYSKMLTQVSASATQSWVTLDGGFSKYNSVAAKPRKQLVIANSWDVTDGGPVK